MPPSRITAEHMLMARNQVRKYTRSAPVGSVDEDALEGAALEALVVAERGFDPEAGATFDGWLSSRVWYAIRDECRRLDANPRSVLHGERPRTWTVSMASPVAGAEDVELGEVLADPRDQIASRECLADAVQCLREMPDRERVVLTGMANGRCGADLARELGVSESRVSQLRTAGIARLAA